VIQGKLSNQEKRNRKKVILKTLNFTFVRVYFVPETLTEGKESREQQQ